VTITVSVICPVHNRRHLIGDTLKSLMAQTRAPDEIIVVDDASTDGTADFVRAFAPGVQVIALRDNQGPGAARNAGLRQATGSHVIFFDSDDLATDDYIAARVECAEATGADIVYGPWTPVWIEKGRCEHDGYVRQVRAVPRPPRSAFLGGWVLFIPNCLIRLSLLRAVGGYPDAIRTGEDMLLVWRLLTHGDKVLHMPRSLLLVRQHPEGQISAASDGGRMRARDELILTETVANELRDGPHAASIGWIDRIRWRARRAAAHARAQALDIESETVAQPAAIERSAAWIAYWHRRVGLALSRIRLGIAIDGDYAPAPITPAQIEQIRRLGLAPQRRAL
jgi:glycosyltransferase involved in cell wall biosynthesis